MASFEVHIDELPTARWVSATHISAGGVMFGLSSLSDEHIHYAARHLAARVQARKLFEATDSQEADADRRGRAVFEAFFAQTRDVKLFWDTIPEHARDMWRRAALAALDEG